MLGFSLRNALKKIVAGAGYKLVPRHAVVMDVRQMRHFLCLLDLYRMVKTVPGAVVECGVGRGRSFLQFAYLMQLEGKGRMLWGFDSFEGFPEPAVEDASPRMPKKGEWSGTSPQDITSILVTAGIDPSFTSDRMKLVPGFFDRTLSKYDGQPIAFLHIDADLYEAYRDALTALVPHVSRGGVVLFDEYGEEKWPGATRAVDEFLKGTEWKLLRHDEGERYYFVKT